MSNISELAAQVAEKMGAKNVERGGYIKELLLIDKQAYQEALAYRALKEMWEADSNKDPAGFEIFDSLIANSMDTEAIFKAYLDWER